jgi:hypothetical protein
MHSNNSQQERSSSVAAPTNRASKLPRFVIRTAIRPEIVPVARCVAPQTALAELAESPSVNVTPAAGMAIALS